ncbi:MAG: GNAT family N-acetyltransferase [Pseudomonadota bacterium]
MIEPLLDLRLRQGVAEDAPACAAILNSWIDATPWMPRVHPADDVVRHYREDVFAKRVVWVAGDPVLGFLALDTETGLVTALYVGAPGQGIGTALLDRAKESRSELELWTFVANEGARRFYAREGFGEVRRTEGDNEERLPDILFRWEA